MLLATPASRAGGAESGMLPLLLAKPPPAAPALCSARWRCWECCSHPECWSSWCPMPPRRRARCARLCCRMCQNTNGGALVPRARCTALIYAMYPRCAGGMRTQLALPPSRTGAWHPRPCLRSPLQVDLAEALRSSAPPSSASSGRRSSPRPPGGALTPSTVPSSLRSSLEGVGDGHSGSLSGMPRGSPLPPAERAQHAAPQHVCVTTLRASQSAAHVSPFAEAAAAAAASGAMSPVPAGGLSPAGGLRTTPSRGGSVASAVLRQVCHQQR